MSAQDAESVVAKAIQVMWPVNTYGPIRLGPEWADDFARWALLALEEAGYSLHIDGTGAE